MANLKKTYCVCFGESIDRSIPWKEKRNLNNEELTRYTANKFISFLLKNKKIKHTIKTTFSTKKEYDPDTRELYWGLAYHLNPRYFHPHRHIILYRHSVWIFLHEIAHVCAPINSLHDKIFAKQLRKIYGHWKEFKKGDSRNNGKTKKSSAL